MKFNYSKGFTHAGIFHADDIFSTAFLRMLNPEIEIERGFTVPDDFDGIVYDIGGGEFDHHQADRDCRPNGLPYASFGKLWKAFAPDRFSKYVVDTVEKELIESLDAADNGAGVNALAEAFSALNVEWDSEKNSMTRFEEAVILADRFLAAQIKSAQSRERAKEIVEKALESAEDGIVVLPKYCPWKDSVMGNPNAIFVIFPSQRGGYNVRTVPTEENPLVGRVPFPEKWLGREDPELGITFCHPGNFLLATNTLEQAIHVARIAAGLENGQRMNPVSN